MGAQNAWWVWAVVAAFGLCVQAGAGAVLNSSACDENDIRALRDVLNGLESGLIPVWGSGSDCCNWLGISCDVNSSSSVNATRVTGLELPSRKLKGRLVDSIGRLEQLRSLNLSCNLLEGSLPPSVFLLPNLNRLDLSFNDLSGSLPQTIVLPSLSYLNLSSNSLSGTLPPALGDCSLLKFLCLGGNKLSGAIPYDIFRLTDLRHLALQDNLFSGPLSPGLRNLSVLRRVDVSSNSLSGTLPDVFVGLPQLEYFLGQSNSFVGSIPHSLANSASLVLLNLRNNSFEGSISLNCSAMTALTSLDLATNRFTGSVPSSLPSCKQLKNINLARNNFSGRIPESFKSFESLSYLSLSNSSITNLSSALQILQQCKNLTTLILTLNFRHEAFPPAAQHFPNLKVLVVASCGLTGSIPSWLSSLTKLQLLDLSWNRLNGTIPPWFGGFSNLFYLDLSNNSLSGDIPKALTQLPSLISKNFSLEDPSPDFPLFIRRNQTPRGLQFNQVWNFPPTLQLSRNFLTGPVWPQFGKLRKLHVLDLSFNNISGPIPANLSQMTSLETLDLSFNNLSGIIPFSLVNLSFLSKFSVANSNLHGKIPVGVQFLTFPNSSFEGNNLCGGDHGTSPCSAPDQAPQYANGKSKRNKDIIVGMVVGIVFGTVFLLALLSMIMFRAHSSREVNCENVEADSDHKGFQEVVILQNKDDDRDLSLEDLLIFTNNFDQANIIGCGGFGVVYRATLLDGRKLAIKRLSGDCGQMEREFRAEVESLSRAQHPNLVSLQGYCMFKNDRLLIYSYMENGSLDYWLHERFDGTNSLDWDTRLRIAQGAARGLAYLHQSCEPHILHRDIKSSNILLDENFEAHLADFGLARLILPQDTHVTTDLVGTLGYIPPEYGQAAVATYKGDIYSFGVVLLELITGKRPMDMCKPKGSRNMISWVIQMKKESRESEVFDPLIYGKQNENKMRQVLEIACLCLDESPKARPSTQQLVSWLDNIHSL